MKKSFTLVELLIVVVIIGILGTFVVPTYRNIIEDSKSKVCQVNVDTINAALEVYAMEHDSIPGSLSELPARYLERAYAFILEERKHEAWKLKLARLIIEFDQRGLAYAQSTLRDTLRGKLGNSVFVCPSDPSGGPSYGFNAAIAGASHAEFQRLRAEQDILLVGDSTAGTFTGTALTSRHKYFTITGAHPFAIGAVGRRQGNKGLRVVREGVLIPVVGNTTPLQVARGHPGGVSVRQQPVQTRSGGTVAVREEPMGAGRAQEDGFGASVQSATERESENPVGNRNQNRDQGTNRY
ncbi:MAG: prepilin-type N-terminal cleavage/methylation domain-containing protein [Candidatus Omnitrophica bacterium]|nr:prepilin-type N-terminal cleavage/methylation domain-containing protein [Candidatus Omnitrophota bacterium]